MNKCTRYNYVTWNRDSEQSLRRILESTYYHFNFHLGEGP